jgi:Mn2+/Fe2+ NRAMP family transporter
MTQIIKEEKTSSPNGSFWKKLGPGLITGAADDDPSGIATYSQVGAGFGYSMLWTTFITLPLMVGIQIISAKIGRVTENLVDRRYYELCALPELKNALRSMKHIS